METLEPTSDEFDEWMRMPITQWFIKKTQEQKVVEMNRCVTGVFYPDNAEKTTALLGEAIGYIKGLDFLFFLKRHMDAKAEQEKAKKERKR